MISKRSIFGDTAGTMIGTVDSLYAGAPVTIVAGSEVKNLILVECDRAQAADFQILKALNGDFAINTFGQGPVKMTLKGVQPSKAVCKSSKGSNAYIKAAVKNNVEKWYSTINISARRPVALSIGINGIAFKGYAYNLVTQPQSAASGGYSYTLQVIAYPFIVKP